MSDSHRDVRTPAAAPFIAFASTLALFAVWRASLLDVTLLACAAVLALALRAPLRRAFFVALLFASFAALVALRMQSTKDERDRLYARLPADEFTTIRAPVERGWHSVGGDESDVYELRASRFEVVTSRDLSTFDAPVIVILPADPPSPGGATTITAEGWLRKSTSGMYRLSVKSARLVSFSGKANPMSPRSWNRSITAAFDAHAARHPRDARAVALVEAVALGRSEQLPADLRESYKRGGSYHLLVFSGMQIGFAAAILGWLFRAAGRPRLSDLTLLGIAVAAPLFAGNEPSVTRASWMIALYAFSRLLARPTSLENLFFVSALLRLMLVPSDLTDAGFALTYAATAGLLFLGKPLAKRIGTHRRIVAALAFGAGAEIATAPLTLLFFHQIVFGSALVTIALSPILFAMLGCSAVAIASLRFPQLLAIALRGVSLLDRLATIVNDFSADVLRLAKLAPAPPLAIVVAVFIGLALLIASRRRFAPWVAALLLVVPVAVSFAQQRARSHVEVPRVEFLDVGQGDSLLIRHGSRAALIDGGGRRGDDRFGRSVLVPMLVERGITTLDVVALSHPHPDHCRGLIAVMDAIEVRELWISSWHVKDGCVQALIEGARRQETAIVTTDLHPERSLVGFPVDRFFVPRVFKRAAVNNSSVAYRISVGQRRLLLTGDVEREAERELLYESADLLRADVLKVAHHGSRNSTSAAFLEAVSPRVAVISCGLHNPFGHPNGELLERLDASGARTFRTDRDGTIRAEFSGSHLFVSAN